MDKKVISKIKKEIEKKTKELVMEKGKALLKSKNQNDLWNSGVFEQVNMLLEENSEGMFEDNFDMDEDIEDAQDIMEELHAHYISVRSKELKRIK